MRKAVRKSSLSASVNSNSDNSASFLLSSSSSGFSYSHGFVSHFEFLCWLGYGNRCALYSRLFPAIHNSNGMYPPCASVWLFGRD